MREGGLNTCAFLLNNILTTQLDTWTWDNQMLMSYVFLYRWKKCKWNVDNNDASVQNAWYARPEKCYILVIPFPPLSLIMENEN